MDMDNGEKCQVCGKHYSYVWHAPDELWEQITGQKESGLCCMECFDDLATAMGIMLYWGCAVGGYPKGDGSDGR